LEGLTYAPELCNNDTSIRVFACAYRAKTFNIATAKTRFRQVRPTNS
jgi:hypothetical protein